MKKNQIKWFEHLIKLPDNTSAKIILKYLNEETEDVAIDKGQAGKNRLKKTINYCNLNWDSAVF